MNGDRLFALYDRVAEAPAAIARLRRFVLELAVRGKLVEQDSADEPASELLKHISAEKARLIKAGRIRKKHGVNPKMVSQPFDLPPTWRWVSLGAAFLYDVGAKREPKVLNRSLWLLELEDIEKDTGRLVSRIRTAERDPKSTKSEFLIGDILYGKLRPYLNKVIVADEPGYSTTEIVAIRPYVPLCPRYCSLALRRPDFVAYVTRVGQGTKMPRLRTEDAIVAPFPLPPLAEQRRIVAKVDELMVLCDQLETARTTRKATRDRLTSASLNRLTAPGIDADTFRTHARVALDSLPAITKRPDQIKTLRQAILSLAVRGKVVKQHQTDEPATELLKRIASKRERMLDSNYPNASEARTQQKKQEKQTLPDNLPELPTDWHWATLQQCSLIVVDCKNKTAPYSSSGIKLVRTTNVRDGQLNSEDQRYVTEEIYKAWSLRAKPEPGDILITREAPMGEVCIVPDGEHICLGQRMMLVRLVPDTIDAHYLLYSLRDPDLMERVQDKPIGMTVQHLRVGGVETLLIPLPPLAEQRRIVATLNELMDICTRLEGGMHEADTTRRRLLDALLHETLGDEALAPTVEALEAAG